MLLGKCFQAFALQVDFRFHFERENRVAYIEQEIDFGSIALIRPGNSIVQNHKYTRTFGAVISVSSNNFSYPELDNNTYFPSSPIHFPPLSTIPFEFGRACFVLHSDCAKGVCVVEAYFLRNLSICFIGCIKPCAVVSNCRRRVKKQTQRVR